MRDLSNRLVVESKAGMHTGARGPGIGSLNRPPKRRK